RQRRSTLFPYTTLFRSAPVLYQGAEQEGERRYIDKDNKQAEKPRDLDGAGPTSRKRTYLARQRHCRERIGFQQAEAMQRAITRAEHGDDEMSRMEVDLSGQAVILQESVEDEEEVLVGNPPVRIKKSEQKKRDNQSGEHREKAFCPAQRGQPI